MTNCCVIIYTIIFIFALKHQLEYLNMWVYQYLNKMATIIKYGAKVPGLPVLKCLPVVA